MASHMNFTGEHFWESRTLDWNPFLCTWKSLYSNVNENKVQNRVETGPSYLPFFTVVQ